MKIARRVVAAVGYNVAWWTLKNYGPTVAKSVFKSREDVMDSLADVVTYWIMPEEMKKGARGRYTGVRYYAPYDRRDAEPSVDPKKTEDSNTDEHNPGSAYAIILRDENIPLIVKTFWAIGEEELREKLSSLTNIYGDEPFVFIGPHIAGTDEDGDWDIMPKRVFVRLFDRQNLSRFETEFVRVTPK